MDGQFHQIANADLPGWVPENMVNYLQHTVAGLPIRELARQQGCHASTVMRQIRRIEQRRDDPLVDAGLIRLGQGMETGDAEDLAPVESALNQDAVRVLRRLCETGAVMAMAEGMPNAIVMRGGEDGAGARTAVVQVEIAQAMALCDWITCAGTGKIARYHISAAGRARLGQLVAEAENRARSQAEGGFAEAQAGFTHAGAVSGAVSGAMSGALAGGVPGADLRKTRYVATESPLIALARRRDKDGQRFLDDRMVRAGERLREDFELAQLGQSEVQDWRQVLSAGGGAVAASAGVSQAQVRLATALDELGPGLADVALRCCCYLEGLERTEKRMGWSARSGKIVLRIALQRLSRHYQDAAKTGGDLIG